MSRFLTVRFVASVLALLLVSNFLQAQSRYGAISEQDEAGILESLIKLELEKKTLGSEIGYIRTFASANLSSVSARQLEKHGFTMIRDDEIQIRKTSWVIDYLMVRNMELKNGLVTVMISAVTEGRPCFGPAFRSQRSFTYTFRKEGEEWVGQLLRTSFPMSYPRKSFTTP